MIQRLNTTDRSDSNARPVRNVPGSANTAETSQRGVGARRMGRNSEAFSIFDVADRSQTATGSQGLGQQWRLSSYLRRNSEASRDPVISPRQTSGTDNNSSSTTTPSGTSSTSTSTSTSTTPATTGSQTAAAAATSPLTPPSPIETLTAALKSAGVDPSGIKMSEHWDFVSYPGGGYTNHLITVESGGRTENIMVNLMTMDPRVAVGDIQRMINRPAAG